MTCAMMSVVPLDGSAVAEAVSVMLEPDGASSGTLWHAVLATDRIAADSSSRMARGWPILMKSLNILVSMGLAGQASVRRREGGYAMAALLVAMSIMAVMMTVAMPVWKQIATREKEEELVFRGEQYARAIGLFQRKFANSAPPNLDVLVEQRFLRKKYKDPITNDDFALVLQAPSAPGSMPGGGRGAATPGGASPLGPAGGAATAGRGGGVGARGGNPAGGQ